MSPAHHTPPDPEPEPAEGFGTMIAGWTIEAMQGAELDPDRLPPDEARSLRRVAFSVAALRAERGPGGAAALDDGDAS